MEAARLIVGIYPQNSRNSVWTEPLAIVDESPGARLVEDRML